MKEGSRPTPMLLPESISFDGTGDWHAFIHHFKLLARESGWDPACCKSKLCLTLKDDAGIYAMQLIKNEPNISYEYLVARLQRHFITMHELQELLQMELSYARQPPKENLLQWADRVIS